MRVTRFSIKIFYLSHKQEFQMILMKSLFRKLKPMIKERKETLTSLMIKKKTFHGRGLGNSLERLMIFYDEFMN